MPTYIGNVFTGDGDNVNVLDAQYILNWIVGGGNINNLEVTIGDDVYKIKEHIASTQLLTSNLFQFDPENRKSMVIHIDEGFLHSLVINTNSKIGVFAVVNDVQECIGLMENINFNTNGMHHNFDLIVEGGEKSFFGFGGEPALIHDGAQLRFAILNTGNTGSTISIQEFCLKGNYEPSNDDLPVNTHAKFYSETQFRPTQVIKRISGDDYIDLSGGPGVKLRVRSTDCDDGRLENTVIEIAIRPDTYVNGITLRFNEPHGLDESWNHKFNDNSHIPVEDLNIPVQMEDSLLLYCRKNNKWYIDVTEDECRIQIYTVSTNHDDMISNMSATDKSKWHKFVQLPISSSTVAVKDGDIVTTTGATVAVNNISIIETGDSQSVPV